jgi:hypothetical protein
MPEDRKKLWWTIVDTVDIGIDRVDSNEHDNLPLQLMVQEAISEMTEHFGTSFWALETLTASTYTIDTVVYITITMIGSTGPA